MTCKLARQRLAGQNAKTDRLLIVFCLLNTQRQNAIQTSDPVTRSLRLTWTTRDSTKDAEGMRHVVRNTYSVHGSLLPASFIVPLWHCSIYNTEAFQSKYYTPYRECPPAKVDELNTVVQLVTALRREPQRHSSCWRLTLME